MAYTGVEHWYRGYRILVTPLVRRGQREGLWLCQVPELEFRTGGHLSAEDADHAAREEIDGYLSPDAPPNDAEPG